MSDHDQLEQRLRATRASFDEVTIAPDAWQENQRRLAAGRSSRNRRWLAAAAAVVGVLLIGGLLVVGGRGPDAGPPASGGQEDPWDQGNLLGPSVVAEQVTVDGETLDHEIVLSDTTGQGPTLCDRLVAESHASGSCSAREPGADKDGVAFDWLSGSEGDSSLRGVLAGVDERVASVDVWMSAGDRVRADLHPTGWEGTQMFALTAPADGAVPQRLVASGGDGNVLQAVDLPTRFGDTWLPPTRSSCEGPATGRWTSPLTRSVDEVRVSWSPTDALVTTRGQTPACLDSLRASALAGWTRIGNRLVVVVGPETKLVQVMNGEDLVAYDEATAGDGSPLRVVVFTGLGEQVLQKAELLARGPLNEELDREFVNQPKSP